MDARIAANPRDAQIGGKPGIKERVRHAQKSCAPPGVPLRLHLRWLRWRRTHRADTRLPEASDGAACAHVARAGAAPRGAPAASCSPLGDAPRCAPHRTVMRAPFSVPFRCTTASRCGCTCTWSCAAAMRATPSSWRRPRTASTSARANPCSPRASSPTSPAMTAGSCRPPAIDTESKATQKRHVGGGWDAGLV